ncbi:hypothetical protein BE04_15145 [Sorangium cellulosum]|uniref:Uncharacterized protein n=1 Tax=Sorangium cellulosum TaxID=56 RepID=A0A150PN16_SORCE|nr:hypothetical protein BE04_15145 [Sorangium cellulosum]
MLTSIVQIFLWVSVFFVSLVSLVSLVSRVLEVTTAVGSVRPPRGEHVLVQDAHAGSTRVSINCHGALSL